MNRQNRAFGIYVVLIILIAGFLIFRTTGTSWHNEESYSEVALKADLEKGNVKFVRIEPNHEVPSGEVQVTLNDSGERWMYTADVNEVVKILMEHGIAAPYAAGIWDCIYLLYYDDQPGTVWRRWQQNDELRQKPGEDDHGRE